MPSLKSQQGLSAMGWLFVISVFGFSLLTVSKLGPHYLDNRFVVETLKTLADDPELPRMSVREIRTKLKKTFTINNIRGKPTESVKINKTAKATIISIQYEERIKFLHNIDVLLSFNSVLDSSQPDKCCRPPKQ